MDVLIVEMRTLPVAAQAARSFDTVHRVSQCIANVICYDLSNLQHVRGKTGSPIKHRAVLSKAVVGANSDSSFPRINSTSIASIEYQA